VPKTIPGAPWSYPENLDTIVCPLPSYLLYSDEEATQKADGIFSHAWNYTTLDGNAWTKPGVRSAERLLTLRPCIAMTN